MGENVSCKLFKRKSIYLSGWIEKDVPACGPLDAIVKPLAVSPCTSDIHTVWEGAIGERSDMILGHEAVGEVVEVGSLVKDFKVGDKVLLNKNSGQSIKIDGEDYTLVYESEIIAVAE